jgi:hypothetical protein
VLKIMLASSKSVPETNIAVLSRLFILFHLPSSAFVLRLALALPWPEGLFLGASTHLLSDRVRPIE